MNASEAVAFLRDHQPMPPDAELSTELIARYDEARVALQRDPDPRGLPALLHSFGEGTGFGVYQLVDDTLRAYPRDDVVAALAEALASPVTSVRSWAMELALDYSDPRLVSPAIDNLSSEDRDTRYFAVAYLADFDGDDERIGRAFKSRVAHEEDPEIRNILLEFLDQG